MLQLTLPLGPALLTVSIMTLHFPSEYNFIDFENDVHDSIARGVANSKPRVKRENHFLIFLFFIFSHFSQSQFFPNILAQFDPPMILVWWVTRTPMKALATPYSVYIIL